MGTHIAKSAILYDQVLLGDDSIVDEFVVLGVVPRNHSAELETHIGAGAFIRSHTVIYAGNTIGVNFQTGRGRHDSRT